MESVTGVQVVSLYTSSYLPLFLQSIIGYKSKRIMFQGYRILCACDERQFLFFPQRRKMALPGLPLSSLLRKNAKTTICLDLSLSVPCLDVCGGKGCTDLPVCHSNTGKWFWREKEYGKPCEAASCRVKIGDFCTLRGCHLECNRVAQLFY